MDGAGRILLVQDNGDDLETLAQRLRGEGFEVTTSTDKDRALELVCRRDFEAVAADLELGEERNGGLTLAERVSSLRDVPLIVLSGYDRYEDAVAALRIGVFDLLTKPVGPESLALALARAVRHHRTVNELARLADLPRVPDADFGILGRSRAIREVRSLIQRISRSDIGVLITGESGTGKELVGRALHDASPRADHRYVAINCGAVPEQLLESELFGHKQGAFTDAKEDRDGLFVQAHGGTLFLDEIGDMPLGMQVKLLRALEEERVRPVGATEEVAFDTRIVAATNMDLEEAIDEGTFREDLFYRLNVVSIALPPLRARETDVLLLAQAFVEREAETQGRKVTGLTQPAASKLLSYGWPGNVRELANVIARAVLLTKFEEITVEDLPPHIENFEEGAESESMAPELLTLEDLERRHVQRVLSHCGGNRSQAAKILGIDRRTLYRKVKRFGLGNEA
jgi:two-component system response regulator HydG